MSFFATDDPSHEGQTNTWLTPLPLIKSLREFELDPCAFPGHITARTRWHGPPSTCGLTTAWFGRVWLNPPYGRDLSLWLTKLKLHGNGIALVFARTETTWFQQSDADAYFFLKGRIKFLNSKFETESNAGCGSVLLAYGWKNADAILESKLEGRAY